MIIKIDPVRLAEAKVKERERIEAQRRVAYQEEADPIFFMIQRGEASLEDWEAKILEVKARFPYSAE